MTTSINPTSSAQLQLSDMQDRVAIADLIYSLGACLDEHRFDDLRTLFTEDAIATTPGGTAQGRDALIAQATRNHQQYARLQHSMTNLLIDLNGDHASVRANLHVTFAGESGHPELVLGAVYRFRAQREEDSWRLDGLEVTPVWRQETK